jgi:hypothetical protein
MSQPEMKEKLSIVSPTMVESENENEEEYSEWRLLHSTGLRGASFETVVVNEGFQNKDFQTSEGVFSVIDPEILGKLRKQASALRNLMREGYIAIVGALYLILVLPVVLLVSSASDKVFLLSLFASICVCVILSYIAGLYMRKITDAKLATLVESYKPRFLTDYGVELGYGRFNSPSLQGGGCCCSKAPGIYLRRPRRLVDVEKASVGGESDALDGGRIPPIYIFRLIPGELDIDEKTYDASSMKVDAEAWALLQSTHQTMIQWHPMVIVLAILCFIGSYVGMVWVSIQVGRIIGHMISFVYIFFMIKIYTSVLDRRNLRVCEQVTKVVNEALQQDKNTAHLAVEFHDSELPGREGKFGRRCRFVRLDLTPTRSELV